MTHNSSNDTHRHPHSLIRQKLQNKNGKEYWRSLNELANTEEFDELIREEFPREANIAGSMKRRDFLKVLSASLAMAGLVACTPQSNKKIMPYTRPPEELVPGVPVYYASAMVQDGFAKGVLIETSMGRPIKVEGNPNHPASLGATDVFMQASILELYDPDRGSQITNNGQAKTWDEFTTSLASLTSSLGDGAGLRILTGPVTSPTLNSQISTVLEQYPQARWVTCNPGGQGIAQSGDGQPFQPVYDFARADVILSLDCDFLQAEPGHLRYSREFANRHQPISAGGTMNRLYVVESGLSITGANADHRMAIKPSQVENFARALANQLGINVQPASTDIPGQNWLGPLADDLRRAGGSALVIAGERQSPAVHALARAINTALGSIGNTVTYGMPVVYNPADGFTGMRELVTDLNNGAVDLLMILEGNPAYQSPADLEFSSAIQKAGTSIYLGLYPDETAQVSTWYVPAAHYIEMWSDARAYDGTVSIIQPVIEPLYGGHSAHELIAALQGQGNASGLDLVRGFWQPVLTGENFELVWREALSKGVLASGAQALGMGASAEVGEGPAIGPATAVPSEGLEIAFRLDETVWDGRFANNAWLQELPKSVTKLTWDNAALISPATAERLGAATNDVVQLTLAGRSVDAPVYILPGLPEDVVEVSLGYGRTAGGNLLEGLGVNANAIRTSTAPWFSGGLVITPTGREYRLAVTHEHWTMENRHLIREATLEEYQAHPDFAQEGEGAIPTMYGEYEYPGYSWGMSINLNTCIGCNACVIACQSENNIPTVGKDQVMRGREMHWIRIDRYYEGSAARPRYLFQPVPCMHCEKAPCEPVCPVAATSHSAEGLNEMTYNRCVGTRFCSNNCPYKVRRFNFYKYNDFETPAWRAMRNPDVTVRSRGVMEKCTFCVQRINQVRIQADTEGRTIQDGELQTACQQACPTRAIIFGNMNDSNSQVRRLKETPLNYALLGELGTQPRTTYLAKVKNVNPLIGEEVEA